MISISELIGHFHPVLVHLPIGILLLAGLFLLVSRKGKFAWMQPTIDGILFIGMVTAVLSCITGYMLSQSGEYEGDLVETHQWMGIGVAVVAVITYVIRRKKSLVKWEWTLGALLTLLLLITGHQGGSLTHGEDYLTAPMENLFDGGEPAVVKRKPIPNVQEAAAYADVVLPVFQSKCYTCHGASKQKGKLRMDQQELLMKGGKNGEVIVPGKADESEIIKRLLLPRNDEHHMAPKEKPQVTAQETELLQWWINSGADFVKKVKDIPQPPKIVPLLLALQQGHEEKKAIPDVPETPVEKASDADLQKLKDAGVIILPVAQNSNYLTANFILLSDSGDNVIKLLLPVKKQLVWLKLGGMKISDTALTIVAQCQQLTRLHLDRTNITDKGIASLASLKQLQLLNLVGTNATAQGVGVLKDIKSLQSLYLYQTKVEQKDWPALKKTFPKTILDSGGYKLEFIPSDTVELTKPLK